ncbi:helix-turn-helix domain-containing protein [Acinetobacter sp. ME22]|uniref:helix-turn-helix domain-containing protein n=1 Tax=Acinetobacter sp. ME22 TaxID=2904802 RepID=UPI001EDC33CC|nr:helix-turn-helix transcriptional regulator [Acinetobacter sp. ME22]MCG2575202.1 helix-turn-helix domain-containing protein [Acinetobacter sp. ME22]
MKVKNNVASLREKAGLSVYELSKRCGFVSDSRVLSNYITRAEQGHSVKIDTALAIYQALKQAGVCEEFHDVFWLEDSEH